MSFDAGGTLLAPWPSVGQVYAQVAAEHGFGPVDAALVERQFFAAWKRKRDFDYSLSHWQWVVEQSFQGVVAPDQIRNFFEQLYARFAGPEVWRVFEDVIPSCESLRRQGLRLVVVSNWDERLRPLLDALGIARFFEFIAVSGEIGFHKPAPEIFRATAARLDLPGCEILHIGDNRREDVEGPRQAGWRALLLNRAGPCCANDEIKSLLELPESGPLLR